MEPDAKRRNLLCVCIWRQTVRLSTGADEMLPRVRGRPRVEDDFIVDPLLTLHKPTLGPISHVKCITLSL